MSPSPPTLMPPHPASVFECRLARVEESMRTLAAVVAGLRRDRARLGAVLAAREYPAPRAHAGGGT